MHGKVSQGMIWQGMESDEKAWKGKASDGKE